MAIEDLQDADITHAIVQIHGAISAHEKQYAASDVQNLRKHKACLGVLLTVARLLEACDELEFRKHHTEAEEVQQIFMPLLRDVEVLIGDTGASTVARTCQQVMRNLTTSYL